MSFFHSFEFFATRFDIERLVEQIHNDLGCNLSGFTHLGRKGCYEETPLRRISLEQALGPDQDRFTSYLFRTEDTPLPEGTAPEHDHFDVAKVTLFKYPQFLQPHVAARYKIDADLPLIDHMFDHSMGRPTPKNEKTQALWKLILSLVKRRARYPLYTAFWERDGRSYLFQTSFVCTADTWRLFRAGGFIEKEKPSRWADFVPEPPPWWDGFIYPKVPHQLPQGPPSTSARDKSPSGL